MSNRAQYRRFLRRCFRRNPAGTFGYLWAAEWNYVILPWMRDRLEKLGVKPVLKWIYGRLVGSPVRS